MVRPSLPYAAIACVAMLLNGCAIRSVPPTTTVWNKLGVPQAFDAANANLINRRGNHPQWERKPPLKRIADPANLKSPNPAIKAAAEIKAEEDMAPQKIKALKYLATIGCGCYDKEGKVEAAILAGLNDCTEDVRKAAVETIQALAGNCGCQDGCGNGCCTEKIQEKLQDMAYGETDGCWHEPSAEVRSMAMQALSACPPISVEPKKETIERETVPTPSILDRETAPNEPLPPIPPPAPMETSAPVLKDTEFVQLTSAAAAPQAAESRCYAPVNVGFVEEVAATPNINPSVKTVSAEATAKPTAMVIHDEAPNAEVQVEEIVLTEADETPKAVTTKVEFVITAKSIAVMHMPKASKVKVGEILPVQIHSRRGDHTVEGKVSVTNIDGGLVYVRPIDGLALRVLRPGSSVTINR